MTTFCLYLMMTCSYSCQGNNVEGWGCKENRAVKVDYMVAWVDGVLEACKYMLSEAWMSGCIPDVDAASVVGVASFLLFPD